MSSMGGAAAAEWPVGASLNKGKQSGVAIGSGANNDSDILCTSDSTLAVQVDLTGAAAGDLTVQVIPFQNDGLTPMGLTLAPVTVSGPTFSGGHIFYTAQFDVSSYDKVRLRITNNNAGAQTITRASWKLTA